MGTYFIFIEDFSQNVAFFILKSGVARQNEGTFTVANIIEDLFKSLQSKCELKSKFYVSSRTDAGVHAICNTGHLDLNLGENYLSQLMNLGSPSPPSLQNHHQQLNDLLCQDLMTSLNNLLIKQNYLIR